MHHAVVLLVRRSILETGFRILSNPQLVLLFLPQWFVFISRSYIGLGTSPHRSQNCLKTSRCTASAYRASSRFFLPENIIPMQPDSQPQHSRPGRPVLRTALAHGSGVPLGRSPSIVRVRIIWEAKLASQGQGVVTPPIESFTMRSMHLHRG